MTQEIVITKPNMALWECPQELQNIKEIYGKNLSNGEFSTLVQIGRATGLNPYLREVWAIKYGDNPASIFIGRDGYRRSAQANPNYDYHHVEAVYSNDQLHYDLEKGTVSHKQEFNNRKNLVGAFCITKRKNSSKPVFVFVDLKEYTTGKSLWATKPATMIKKVAEAQCLRMAFQELFGGTYAEEEMQQERDITPQVAYIPEGVKEGVPLSQSNTMDAEILEECLQFIKTAPTKQVLQVLYIEAKEKAKGDKIASNKISIATKARLEEIKNIPVAEEAVKEILEPTISARDEFYAEYDRTEVKK